MRSALTAFALLLGLFLCAPAMAQQAVTVCAQPASHEGSCANEITPSGVSTAPENGHIIEARPGVAIGFQVNNWSTSTGLTVMALDATTIPSNGTLATCSGTPAQTNPCIAKWYGVPEATSSAQSGTLGVNWTPGPFLHFLNGLVLVCSSTGPTTLTLSANCTFSAEVQ